MKHSLLTLPFTLIVHGIKAHYVFSKLIVNNTLTADFQYVRDTMSVQTPPTLWGKAFPIYNLSNPDLVCGRSAFPVLNPRINTATVLAGDEMGFQVSGPYYEGDTQPYIFHEGPGQIFLSKLPDGLSDLKDYDGKGDFFKISYQGPKDNTTWSTMGAVCVNFTIPATTPPGKYLLRIEHFFPSGNLGQSQWFVNCAHVNIVGNGNGSPTGFVRFPNAYKEEDQSIWFHVGDKNSAFPKDISVYVEPAPCVWEG